MTNARLPHASTLLLVAALAACAPPAGMAPAGPVPVAPAGSPAATPAAAASGAPAAPAAFAPDAFPEPPVLRSRDGVLEATLTAAPKAMTVAGQAVTVLAYNGSFPGPTMRVKPGDRLKLKLVNQLGEVTNFHAHGLHVSPSGIADNALRQMAAGTTSDIEIEIPKDHPGGTFWYHPHIHGKTTDQVRAGLAGALIVEGDVDALPAVAGLRERTVVLQEVQFGADGKPLPDERTDFAAMLRLVNGQKMPSLPIAPGETQRWRVLNASGSTFYRLKLDGHQLVRIANDGNTMRAPLPSEDVLLAPGDRLDLLVTGGAAGAHALRTLAVAAGFDATPAMDLATVVSAGAAQQPRPLPAALLPYEDLRGQPVDRARRITFGNTNPPEGVQIQFLVDGRTFDPARIDVVAKLGALEEWTVENLTTDDHPFHIHTNPIQVVAVNGEPVDAPSLVDTEVVPKMDEQTKKPGSLTFRTRYRDFTGQLVFHCHILPHEDGGMMGLMEISADGTSHGASGHAAHP